MNKLPIGIVGLNFGQKIIFNALSRSPASELFDIRSVCSKEENSVADVMNKLNCRGYTDLDQMLSDDDISAVILLTGPEGRAEQIRRIIHSGKDVMTTKPFETCSAKAASILKEARDLDRIVYLNSPCPNKSRDLRLIDHWREKYDLGRPVGGHYECWYARREAADGTWYDDPELCPVPPITRLGIYGITDFIRILGEPENVQVMESRLFTGRPTSDYARMNIRFKNGALGGLVAGWVTEPERPESSLILYFENGTIYRNPALMPSDGISYKIFNQYYMSVVTKECRDGMPIESKRLPAEQISREYQWDVFYQTVTTRKRPVDEVDDQVIVDSVRVLEAMRKAAKTGCTEPVI